MTRIVELLPIGDAAPKQVDALQLVPRIRQRLAAPVLIRDAGQGAGGVCEGWGAQRVIAVVELENQVPGVIRDVKIKAQTPAHDVDRVRSSYGGQSRHVFSDENRARHGLPGGGGPARGGQTAVVGHVAAHILANFVQLGHVGVNVRLSDSGVDG